MLEPFLPHINFVLVLAVSRQHYLLKISNTTLTNNQWKLLGLSYTNIIVVISIIITVVVVVVVNYYYYYRCYCCCCCCFLNAQQSISFVIINAQPWWYVHSEWSRGVFAEEHENTVTASPCFVVRTLIIQPPTIFLQKCFLNISLFKLIFYAGKIHFWKFFLFAKQELI